MIHVRVDSNELNADQVMACGIVGKLPDGDQYFFQSESASRLADCPICNPGGPVKLGVPLSELSGRPGRPGYEKFCNIASSWGYD